MKNLQREEKSERREEGYKNLLIWNKSILLYRKIFNFTKFFPEEEKFGLISQIRRCSVSIPSNIAEGYGRLSPQSFKSFLKIALGSLYELETQMILSKDNGYFIDDNELFENILELKKMLFSFIKKYKFLLTSRFSLFSSLYPIPKRDWMPL